MHNRAPLQEESGREIKQVRATQEVNLNVQLGILGDGLQEQALAILANGRVDPCHGRHQIAVAVSDRYARLKILLARRVIERYTRNQGLRVVAIVPPKLAQIFPIGLRRAIAELEVLDAKRERCPLAATPRKLRKPAQDIPTVLLSRILATVSG